jgi:hypothetical protein
MTELEKYIADGEIEISRHPVTNMRRLLKEQAFIHNQLKKEISIESEVCYMDEGGEIINYVSMPSYDKVLTADTRTMIDPQTMSPVTEGGVSEYDFFVGMANAQINIFQVRLDVIKLRDSQGKFD